MKTNTWTLAALILSASWCAGAEQNWTHFVRIGGHSLQLGRAGAIVRSAVGTNVYGIEVDNDITGRYESLLDPAAKLRAIRELADAAHAAGQKAFVYIAGTECITANADKAPRSMFKDHPDWVQRKITGEPAVFTGGAAFWIRKGDEDVWISPYASEWRKTYMERVRQIAATGIDGVYVDIPYWMTHFDGWEDSWASFDDHTVAAFKAKTGLDAKKDIKVGDFADPGFRKWVDFRITTLTEFMREIDENVKKVNPQCMTIPEIYPGIEAEAVRVGSDVYEMYRVTDAIAHEYEFDGGAAIGASKTPLDWLHYMTGMYTFRAFAEGKASWMLSYSWDGEKSVDPKEAMKNLFAAQLTAGTNSWDAATHVMSGSNDMATRKAIFGWIAAHEKIFYRPRIPLRPIGVYFSPATRNYFAREWMESYLGTMAMLLQSHREFEIVTPRTLPAFRGEVLVLPDARCLSEKEMQRLEKFAGQGKALILTGETGKLDERAEARPGNAVTRLVRSAGNAAAPRVVAMPKCPGRAYWALLGKQYDRAAASGDPLPDTTQATILRDTLQEFKYQPAVEIAASPFVTAQIAKVDGKVHVFLANFKGLKSKENAVQIPEKGVRISFPADAGQRVHFLPYLDEASEIRSERKDGRLSCILPDIHKAAVVWVD